MQDFSGQGFRLSPQQRQLWFLEQAAGGQSFSASSAIAIDGELQPSELLAAIHDVVSRHEILRTTFVRPVGVRTPFQVVAEVPRISSQTVDLSAVQPEEQAAEINDRFGAATREPFDLEQGPLLRVAVIKLSEQRHVLMLSLPALCADSLTLSNFARELVHSYEARLKGQESGREPMQYADFAEWQNELLEAQDEHGATGREFWQQQQGVLAPALPLEKRREETQVFSAESVPVELGPPFLRQVVSLAANYNISVESILFACWQTLIWRLTAQQDLTIFSFCDGRKFEELKTALGLYGKYLPVRCRRESVSAEALFKKTHDALSNAAEHQEYFDPAADWDLAKDAIAFEFAERPDALKMGGLSFSLLEGRVCTQPFKLKLSCFCSGDKLTVELQYNRRQFERVTVERFAGYFAKLAGGLVQSFGQPIESQTNPIDDIDPVSDDERRTLLVEFNRTGSEYADDKCIQQLFEGQVEQTPEATALVFEDQELTYRELNARANQLAHHLRKLGVGPGRCVGLSVERGLETIVCLLGVLKAGGAYVPLNPEHPSERLAIQLAECKASVLITDQNGESLPFSGTTVHLDRDRELLDAAVETNPSLLATPDDLAYVIYTSGSTGIPKGVAVRQRNLVNYAQFIGRRLATGEPLSFATVSTITADLGNTCIFPSLTSGGCLHIVGYNVSMEGELFRDYLAKREIEVLKIVPSHLNALLASQPDGSILPTKYLILGGETLSWELVDRISQTAHHCKIINHYGPTETTVGSLTFSVDANDKSPYSLTAPIGRPIANTRVYILDDRLRPTPIGVAGELYIGGAGVAAGYLNQPAETAARFVADPFANEPGSRLYRTGDLARYLPDGNVEFLGRVDTQVKVRGFRVELAEIEAQLAAHPDVQQAVVTSWPQPGRSEASESSAVERLAAYLVTQGGRPAAQEALRAFLKQKLPDYMIPSAFVFLKSLPLTANGKIDRAALPAPDDTRAESQRTFVAPRTPVEKELALIWAELLKVGEVGVDDNFFDLGGHSLLATQVVSRMRKTFQMEIPLRSLFELPTVGALAAKIEEENKPETAHLLDELEDLSEEEAERLLGVEKARQLE